MLAARVFGVLAFAAVAAVAARWQLVGCVVEDDRPVAVRAAVATLARLFANAVHDVQLIDGV